MSEWNEDSYNWFVTEVYMSASMAASDEIMFYLERVRPGVSIVFDNTQMIRECGGK